MTKVEFQKACLEAGIQLNEEQMNQFEKYMQLLIEWNEKMNLTAITQEEEVWRNISTIQSCLFQILILKQCVILVQEQVFLESQ